MYACLPFHPWVYVGNRDIQVRFAALHDEPDIHSMMVRVPRNTNLSGIRVRVLVLCTERQRQGCIDAYNSTLAN